MDAAKAAIAHAQQVIAGLHLRLHLRHLGHPRCQPHGRVPMGASASRASQSSPPAWQKARSVSSRLQGNWDFMAPSFMVLLRGSKMARMRSPPTRRRSPLTVVRMAVG